MTVERKTGRRVLCLGLLCVMLAGCGETASRSGQERDRTAAVPIAEAAPGKTDTAEASAEEAESPETATEETAPETAASDQAPRGLRILVDGEEWTGSPETPSHPEDLMVYIARGQELLISFPFSEAHLISVIQEDGAENHILMTGTLVKVTEANCGNQDCVGMGEVTRENLNERVLGGFIVCLPHRLTVEVREP